MKDWFAARLSWIVLLSGIPSCGYGALVDGVLLHCVTVGCWEITPFEGYEFEDAASGLLLSKIGMVPITIGE